MQILCLIGMLAFGGVTLFFNAKLEVTKSFKEQKYKIIKTLSALLVTIALGFLGIFI